MATTLRYFRPNITVVQNDSPSAADIASQSPLWPLQAELRAIVSNAVNSGAPSPSDIAQISDTNSTVENMFSQWQTWPVTTLREAIKVKISPPPVGGLDLSGNPVLAGFQSALLAATHWNDPV